MKRTVSSVMIHLTIWFASFTTSFMILTVNQYWLVVPILALLRQVTTQSDAWLKDDAKNHRTTAGLYGFTMVIGFLSAAIVRNIPGIR